MFVTLGRGPMKLMCNHKKFFILVADEFSGYRWIGRAASKAKASARLLDLLCRLQLHKDQNFCCFHIDNETEFVHQELWDYFAFTV